MEQNFNQPVGQVAGGNINNYYAPDGSNKLIPLERCTPEMLKRQREHSNGVIRYTERKIWTSWQLMGLVTVIVVWFGSHYVFGGLPFTPNFLFFCATGMFWLTFYGFYNSEMDIINYERKVLNKVRILLRHHGIDD